MGAARADDRAMEQYLLSVPTAQKALADATRINAESHYASTPGDYHIATWMRDELTAAGFNASIETFNHDVPFSRKLGLAILLDKRRQLKLALDEAAIPEDPDGTRRDAGPPFNAWSGSGDVLAPLVDAGAGLDADYQALAARNKQVRGALVLVRYGGEFRGNLAKRAQDRGARGVIFFSDPAGRDGSQRGPAYPDGPYRNDGTVQRGALNPGQISIPTLPVPATTAARLIGDMRDGISTHLIHLTVEMTVKHNVPLWNTVGKLIGQDPTHEVILGAHRDAWVYGVTDNGSGISNVLEAARALGYIYRAGWRPRYSIVIVGFDGEEVGELGSRAYVHMHMRELQAGALAYINSDESATGSHFSATAAAALEGLVVPAAFTVRDPANPSRPLASRWESQTGGEQIRPPAGGSDFESFLYDVGTPVMDFGFGGVFGEYHSSYDDLMYATKQADPGFVNHVAIAQLDALLAMRIAGGASPFSLAAYTAPLKAAAPALRASVARFARAAANADARGMDGNQELHIIQTLDMLLYSRNGYAAVPFPEAATDPGRAAADLDAITDSIARATH